MFEERKQAFSPVNETFTKMFINKSELFTNSVVEFNVILNVQTIQSLFNDKDNNSHYSRINVLNTLMNILVMSSIAPKSSSKYWKHILLRQ